MAQETSNLNPELAQEARADVGPSSWRERRNTWPEDTLIRGAGFVIHERPKVGPVLWRLGGFDLLLSHDEALDFAMREVDAKR